MFYVYILYSTKYQKTYTGQTQDLENRIHEHNETATKGYTKSYRPWILLYHEEFQTRGEAMKREKYLKSWEGRIWVKNIIDDYLDNNPS